DVTPVKLSGRIIAGLWMGFSFFVLGDFIATMTAARQAELPIQSLTDLKGQSVAVRAGTTAETYLESRPVNRQAFDSLDGQVQALQDGTAKAMILDYPTARYFVLTNPGFLLAGERLNSENYGIALQDGDEFLEEEINKALIDIARREGLTGLDEKWFGED
ncbi:MAG: transporter substrate-binding domain-containing protein, partial [Cyanobacteria bacterium P01_H01_bin.121]